MSKYGSRAYTEAERIEAFWDKVEKRDGCWEWTAGKDSNGYGQFRDGHRLVHAHRFAYELERGQIGDFYVCHHCDNKKCVNPDHLFLGTQRDNMQDCIAKGRKAILRGEKNGNHKLTDVEVAEIRARAGGYLLRELAAEYGVGFSQISSIIRGKYRALPIQAAG